jgi:ankyrin repeat protein
MVVDIRSIWCLVLEFLLENSADVSLVNNDNNSALHLACMEVRLAIVKSKLSCLALALGYNNREL